MLEYQRGPKKEMLKCSSTKNTAAIKSKKPPTRETAHYLVELRRYKTETIYIDLDLPKYNWGNMFS